MSTNNLYFNVLCQLYINLYVYLSCLSSDPYDDMVLNGDGSFADLQLCLILMISLMLRQGAHALDHFTAAGVALNYMMFTLSVDCFVCS
jgi:hypothetical protein